MKKGELKALSESMREKWEHQLVWRGFVFHSRAIHAIYAINAKMKHGTKQKTKMRIIPLSAALPEEEQKRQDRP